MFLSIGQIALDGSKNHGRSRFCTENGQMLAGKQMIP